MNKEIHPKYHTKAKVICACGNNFETGSIMEELKVELCSMCHPFYTGKQKLVDTARRVEKFEAKKEAQKKISKVRKGKKVKRAALAKKKAKKEVKIKADNDVKVVSKKKSIRQAPSKKAGKQDRVGKK